MPGTADLFPELGIKWIEMPDIDIEDRIAAGALALVSNDGITTEGSCAWDLFSSGKDQGLIALHPDGSYSITVFAESHFGRGSSSLTLGRLDSLRETVGLLIRTLSYQAEAIRMNPGALANFAVAQAIERQKPHSIVKDSSEPPILEAKAA